MSVDKLLYALPSRFLNDRELCAGVRKDSKLMCIGTMKRSLRFMSGIAQVQ
jgi:hypothetical protein